MLQFLLSNFLNTRNAFAAKGHIWNDPWTLMKFETTQTVAPWDSPRPSSSLGECWSSALITLLIPEEICLITGPLQLTSFTCHALIWVLLISKRPTWSSTAQEAQETTFRRKKASAWLHMLTTSSCCAFYNRIKVLPVEPHADCTQALELDGCCWNQIFLKGEKEQVCATMFEDKKCFMHERTAIPASMMSHRKKAKWWERQQSFLPNIITGICAGLPADHHICDPSVYKGWLQNCVTFSATIFRAFLEVLSWPLVCWMHRMYKPVWYDSVLSQASRWAFYTLPAGVLKSDVLRERRIRLTVHTFTKFTQNNQTVTRL